MSGQQWRKRTTGTPRQIGKSFRVNPNRQLYGQRHTVRIKYPAKNLLMEHKREQKFMRDRAIRAQIAQKMKEQGIQEDAYEYVPVIISNGTEEKPEEPEIEEEIVEEEPSEETQVESKEEKWRKGPVKKSSISELRGLFGDMKKAVGDGFNALTRQFEKKPEEDEE